MRVINRKIMTSMLEWRNSDSRKPLILRGARQVGKTTTVCKFAQNYDVFLHLNLEKSADRELFERYDDVKELIKAIFMHKQQLYTENNVLIFIDEIQNSKKAVAMLRYFYEEANQFHVIVAGSLLETIIDLRKISFPVGRVQYMALRPCTFTEFLDGIGETFDLPYIESVNVDEAVHNRIMNYFREYILVGGMPAAIMEYSHNRDVLAVSDVYETLLESYSDDVEKYTSSNTMVKVIRSILLNGWNMAAETIAFEGFGGSSFKSREMGEAFQVIQKAMLLELVYPSSETQLPEIPNMRRRPKLLWIDTGLVNYASKIQTDVFSTSNINDVWRGRIAEHIVAQELLAISISVSAKRGYWRSNVNGSEAEVDFLYIYDGKIIPIEVKSGHNAKLKSLHMFMDKSPIDFAIRIWSNPLSVDEVATPNGKRFRLVNVPFYYVGQLEKILRQL